VPTLVIQSIGYFIVEKFCDVNESLLYLLLINSDKAPVHDLTENNVFLFVLYCTVVYIIAWYLGGVARRVVVKNKLDIQYPILRLHNDWHYILSGLILDFPGQPGDSENVNTILKHYVLSKEDGLDRLYLTAVQRRLFKDDVVQEFSGHDEASNADAGVENTVDYDVEQQDELTTDDRYYFMPGDYFILPYQEIKNLNIIYYREEELDN
jgi:hypothetical protein